MGDECLNAVCSILKTAGFSSAADYPAGSIPELTEAVAAVGLEDLVCSEGKAVLAVRILSPGHLGGWNCQSSAAAAVAALETAEIRCGLSPMTHLPGGDCFCVRIRAELDIFSDGTAWHPGLGWKYVCGGKALVGVMEFTAEQDLDRRLVGTFCQETPVGVTPGSGGWKLKLVQRIPANMLEEELPEEPFELIVSRNGLAEVYSGCCWSVTSAVHTQAGLQIQRRGFALSREVK